MEADAEEAIPPSVWMTKVIKKRLVVSESFWTSFEESPKNKDLIQSFLETEDKTKLYFYPCSKGIIVTENALESVKKKGICFFKREAVILNDKNYLYYLKFEELNPRVLDHMDSLFMKVFFPIITRVQNQRGWPKVVSEDVATQLGKFASRFSSLKGKIEGRTVLPIPVMKLDTEEKDITQNLTNSLESIVVEWVSTIRQVVEMSPHNIFDEKEVKGVFLETDFELEFWEAKNKDLLNLQSQVADEKIKKIIRILGTSSYVKDFNDVCLALKNGQSDAALILKELKTVEFGNLTKLDDDFEKHVDSVFQRVAQLWENTQPCYSVFQLISLYRQMCNFVITALSTRVNSADVYKIESHEMIARIDSSLSFCSVFKERFFEVYDAVNGNEEGAKWDFERDIIFTRMNLFIDRLRDVKEILVNMNDLDNLPNISIGGGENGEFRAVLEGIYEQYIEIKNLITRSKSGGDMLDLTNIAFEKTYFAFFAQVQQIDEKLCMLINKRFHGAASVRAGFTVLESFSSQMKRESVKVEINVHYLSLLRKFDAELLKVFNEFSAGSPPLIEGPRVKQVLMWCSVLINRISLPYSKFQTLPQILQDTVEMRTVVKKFEYLSKRIAMFADSEHKVWSDKVVDLNVGVLQRTSSSSGSTRSSSASGGERGVEANTALFCDICDEVEFIKDQKREVPTKIAALEKKIRDLGPIIQELKYSVKVYRDLPEKNEGVEIEINRAVDGDVTWAKSVIDLREYSRRLKKAVDTAKENVVKEYTSRICSLVTFWRNTKNSEHMKKESLTEKYFSQLRKHFAD